MSVLATGPGPRIADVTVRLFTWPVAAGADHDGRPRDLEVELGLVTVSTDDGAEAFKLLPHDLECYGLTESIEVDADGFVHAPQRPGLGFPIDWELVKRRTTRVLS